MQSNQRKGDIFDTVEMAKMQFNRFDLSHDLKMSFNMGELIPTTVMEAVPGDLFEISLENMLRFSPLVSPVMHRIRVHTHFFFVPNRIIWPEFEDFISGDESVAAPTFEMTTPQTDPNTLGTYLGLPLITQSRDFNLSALPLACYTKIYNEYYRDQNLIDELPEELVSGDNTTVWAPIADGPPLKRAWQHDYFTSALPFAQKGDEVLLPTGTFTDVPVYLDTPNPLTNFQQVRAQDGNLFATGNLNPTASGALEAGTTNSLAWIDPNGSLYADTSQMSSVATGITDLRRAFRLQEFLEREARGGTRYTELLKSAFGVISSDKRLQRPEYIGGSYQNMVISEVLSTATTELSGGSVVNPTGALAGHGISVGGSNKFRYRVEEHGFIFGIISVRPDTAYYQGIHKMWNRTDRYDYYWKEFALIGEQAVRNQELFADQTSYDGTFGYVPRYAEYKFVNDRVAGQFQSTLEHWHLGRKFNAGSPPSLNEDFINCSPSDRIFAVDSSIEDTIYAHIFNHVQAVRPMPKFGVPTI